MKELQRFRNPVKLLLCVVFFAVLIWGLTLQRMPDKTTIWNYSYNAGIALVYAMGAVCGFYYVTRYNLKPNLKKALLYFSIGQLSWATATVIWCYYNLVMRIDLPYPSVPDIFYILFIVFMSVGLVYLLKYFNVGITHTHTLETMGILLFTYITVFLVIDPPDLSLHLPALTMTFNFLYPLGDGFLFAISLASVRMGEDRMSPSARYLILALLLQAVGDFFFGYFTVTGTYWNGSLPDIIYVMSGFLISTSIISLATRSQFTPSK